MLYSVAFGIEHLTARKLPDTCRGENNRKVTRRDAAKERGALDHRQTMVIPIIAVDNTQTIGAIGPATQGFRRLARNIPFLGHGYRPPPAANGPPVRARTARSGETGTRLARKSVEVPYIGSLLQSELLQWSAFGHTPTGAIVKREALMLT